MRSVEGEYKITKIKSAINTRTPPSAWCGRLKRMRHIKVISRSSKKLGRLQRNLNLWTANTGKGLSRTQDPYQPT